MEKIIIHPDGTVERSKGKEAKVSGTDRSMEDEELGEIIKQVVGSVQEKEVEDVEILPAGDDQEIEEVLSTTIDAKTREEGTSITVIHPDGSVEERK